MEKISANILESYLKKFSSNVSIQNIMIVDSSGKVIISIEKIQPQIEEILNFLNIMGFFKNYPENNSSIKKLKQIIFDYSDYQIILSVLQTENFILTTVKDKKNLLSILNELKSLVEKVDEFIESKTALEKLHLINLEANIKKLETYLDLMQPPKFKDIKKLIEYIS